MDSEKKIPFWKRKTLAEMSRDEWESLCDGCGRCCLVKFENEAEKTLHFTNVHCRLLDGDTCQCRDYSHRRQHVPDCVVLRPEQRAPFSWLPSTCAYRRLDEGKDLEAWHPLVSGDPESVHREGISVRGKTLSEEYVHPRQLDAHIVDWFDDESEDDEP